MSPSFRFSPRPNRAAEIPWREWGQEAFSTAREADRPVALLLTASWCHWCHVMDETTLSDPAVIALLRDHFVPVRVDADRHPHVRDRYIAGGWPTVAFLSPDGEVLWSGTGLESHEMKRIADGVLRGWSDRREELLAELDRRRLAMETTLGRRLGAALVRREAGDDVLAAMIASADARNGGFGEAPRFPAPDAIELLFRVAAAGEAPQAATLAERCLDGMLAGELFDRVEGGFFRYALQEDWTEPQYEKLLSVNAGLVRAYALAASLLDRPDYRDVAERTVAWALERLARDDGLWASSQAADPDYYALDAAGRAGRSAPSVEPAPYTDAAAAWIRALAEAGGRLGRGEWIELASHSLRALLDAAVDGNGRVRHLPGDEQATMWLLGDAVELARAAVAVGQATGQGEPLRRAAAIVAALRESLLSDEGGFEDCRGEGTPLGALRYRERPFDLNADAARLLLDLHAATGERTYRAIAERVLALLAPQAGRRGAQAAGLGIAVREFFEPVATIALVGDLDSTAELRARALSLPLAARRVWTVEPGGTLGGRSLPLSPSPAAYFFDGGSRSRPLAGPEMLETAARPR